LIIGGGIIVFLMGGLISWFLVQKQKKKKKTEVWQKSTIENQHLKALIRKDQETETKTL
jgi:hypothetical protein